MAKVVKIFVSSLFKEMAIERDVLHHQVNAYFQEKSGEEIIPVFVDLRWGIDTSEYTNDYEKSLYTIERCFEAIEDSDIFLGLLGEDYGSLVERDVLDKLGVDKKYYDYSYTHLEILYAEKHINKNSILFLIKEGKGENRVEEIKEYVKKHYEWMPYEKTGVTTLSPSFISNTISLLKNKLGVAQRKEIVYERPKIIEECVALTKKANFVGIKGAFGSGKTTLLKGIGEMLKSDYKIIYVDLNIVQSLKKEFGNNPLNIIIEKMRDNSTSYVLLVDSFSFDIFSDLYMLYSSFTGQPQKFLLFFTYEIAEEVDKLFGMDVAYFDMPLLSKEDIIPFVEHVVGSYNKVLFKEIEDYIVSKGNRFLTPLSLITLVTEFMILDSSVYSRVRNSYQDYSKGMVNEMRAIIDNFPNDNKAIVSWKIDNTDKFIHPDLAKFITNTIQIYKAPIELSLLIKCFEAYFSRPWSDIDYYTYKYYLKGVIKEENGVVAFSSVYTCFINKIDKKTERKIKEFLYLTLKETNLHKEKMLEFAFEVDTDYFFETINNADSVDEIGYAFAMNLENANTVEEVDKIAKTLIKRVALINKQSIYKSLISSLAFTFVNPRKLFRFHAHFISSIDFDPNDVEVIEYIGAHIDFAVENGLEKYVGDVGEALYQYVVEKDLRALNQQELLEVSSLTYTLYKFLLAIDDGQVKDLYSTLILEITLLDECPPFALRVIEDLSKAKYNLKSLLDALEKKINGDSKHTLLKLGLFNIRCKEQLAIPNNLDNAAPLIKEFYELAKDYYEKRSRFESAIYYFAVASSFYYYYEVTQYNEEGKKKALRDSYNLRLLLCNIAPDNYSYLSALSTITMNLANDKFDIGVPLEDVVEKNYELLKRYAIRGNARLGWLFSNWFKALSNNRKSISVLIDKIKDIDIFLKELIKVNLSNNDNLSELVHVYLDIFRMFCEHRILPLDEGEKLLGRIYEVGKIVLFNEQNEDTYILFVTIYEEIFSIILQRGMEGVTKHPLYQDARAVFLSIKEIDSSTVGQLYGSYQDVFELMASLYMVNDIVKKGIHLEQLKQMGFDPYEALYTYARKLAPLMLKALSENVSVRKNGIALVLTALKHCLSNKGDSEMVSTCQSYYDAFKEYIDL